MAPDREIMKNLLLLTTRSTYVLAKSVAGLEKENNAKKKMLGGLSCFPFDFPRVLWKRARPVPREPRMTPNSAASLSSLRDIIKLNGLKLRYILTNLALKRYWI